MIILAIDPGITGALAFLDVTRLTRVAVFDMPILDGDVNPHALRDNIKTFMPEAAVIEHVAPHPKEGVRSVWRFASAFTTACVVVRLERIPLTLVSPARWKKHLGLKGGPEGKEQARRHAIDCFPFSAQHFNLKKHHGRAEAALLALYLHTINMRNHVHQAEPPVSADNS